MLNLKEKAKKVNGCKSNFTTEQFQLVGVSRVLKMLDISRTTLYRKMQEDDSFPKPVKVGNATKFILHELVEYIKKLKNEFIAKGGF